MQQSNHTKNAGDEKSLIQCLAYFFALSSVMIFTSCSFIQSPIIHRNKEYLNAKSIAPLKIPPGLSSEAFHNEYPISDKTYSDAEQKKTPSLVPPGLN